MFITLLLPFPAGHAASLGAVGKVSLTLLESSSTVDRSVLVVALTVRRSGDRPRLFVHAVPVTAGRERCCLVRSPVTVGMYRLAIAIVWRWSMIVV